MRKIALSAIAATVVAGFAGAALSQDAPAPAPAPASAALSPEDQNAAPFPPGPNAALVKKVCADCHSGDRVIYLRYTREEAENFYKNMVSQDVSTDQAQKILAYLTTVLAP